MRNLNNILQERKNQALRLLLHLCNLLIVYSCCRLCFFLFNKELFGNLDFSGLILIFFKGLRFDIAAICAINILFIFLYLFPYPIIKSQPFKTILKWIFILFNSLFFLFEIGDWGYFMYNHKRSTAEVVDLVGRKGDFLNLLPGLLQDYWFLFLMGIGIICWLICSYSRIENSFKHHLKPINLKPSSGIGVGLLIMLGSITLAIIGIRGGLQYVPINIRNAAMATDSRTVPLVLNTPFSIIYSWQSSIIKELDYMPENEALDMVQPYKYYGKDTFKMKNVVVIVLESFSKEFTKLGNGISYTPFLDSLMDISLTFTNAYANALQSSNALPAILSGIPALMEEPFINSVYSTNDITSIAQLLSTKGYASAFYHGSTNGSMSFDLYTQNAGYKKYYGRTQYKNEKDYDGSWGIWDEPFMQYFAHGLNKMQQPFTAGIFTISSHAPYKVPDLYKGVFAKGSLAIHESIGYTDHALRMFFRSSAQSEWFNNTLFIITADHCSPLTTGNDYDEGLGRYQIPLLFYAPADTSLRGYNDKMVQQIDILPTIMDYLNYEEKFFALGNSAFDSSGKRFVVNRLTEMHDFIIDTLRFKILNDAVQECYYYSSDTLIRLDPQPPNSAEGPLAWKAFMQVYSNSMVRNNMKFKKQKDDK